MSTSFYIAADAPRPGGGIYLCQIEKSGAMRVTAHNNQLEKVMYLTRSVQATDRLYASTNLGDQSAVAAFKVDLGNGELSLINQQPAHGSSPCYIDITENLALVANYSGGHVSVFPIDDKGGLQPVSHTVKHRPSERSPEPGNAPHPHSIVTAPAKDYALSADLGIGEVIVYCIDREMAKLRPLAPSSVGVPAGAGPRHLIFSQIADSSFVYLLNEHDATLIVYTWDGIHAILDDIQILSTLPDHTEVKNHAADLHMHPSGKWLYASNRGHDSIAVLEIDQATGKAKLIQNESTQGSFPRGFAITPDGKFLIAGNEKSNSVFSFHIDQQTGRLTPTGHTLSIPAPLYFAF